MIKNIKKLALIFTFLFSCASMTFARGWVEDGDTWRYVGTDGEYITDTVQTSGDAKFYLDESGSLMKDYFLEDYNGNSYYFGANGAMVKNTWIAISSDLVSNEANGDYTPENYWYYFNASGKAIKGTSDKPKKTTIDGKKYLFNENGQMCTGWIKENGELIDPSTAEEGGPFKEAMYFAGDENDGVLRTGWVSIGDAWNGSGEDYQTNNEKLILYFYFNTTNNKKYGSEGAVSKKINGKTYVFDSSGMMLSGWDVVDSGEISSYNNKTVYFSDENDGSLVKKGWVYTVPSENVDDEANANGEEKWFYFGSGGDAAKDQFKKVNGKYYVFNEKGIMQTGIVVWCQGPAANKPHYVGTINEDFAEGSDIVKKGILRLSDKESEGYIKLDYKGVPQTDSTYNNYKVDSSLVTDAYSGKKLKLHYFNKDGARETGSNQITIGDSEYTFTSNTAGHKESGKSAKKYYSLGFQLKADKDIKYGILAATHSWFKKQDASYKNAIQYNQDGLSPVEDRPTDFSVYRQYEVLNAAGAVQKEGTKKGADGNYWLIGKGGKLLGIFSTNVRKKKIEQSFDVCAWWPDRTDFVANPTNYYEIDLFSLTGPLHLPPLDDYDYANDYGIEIRDINKQKLSLTTLSGLGHPEVGLNCLLTKAWYDKAIEYYGSMDLQTSHGESGKVDPAPCAKWLRKVANGNDIDDDFFKTNAVTMEVTDAVGLHTTPLWDNTTHFTVKITINGYQFESEADGKKQWIWFGMKDDYDKTARFKFVENEAESYFQVVPTNEYFLNCYWDD